MTTSPLYQEPILPELSRLPVSDGALRVASRLWGLALSSASELSWLLKVDSPHVHARLAELKREGFADCQPLGWCREVVERWWLTERTLSAAGLTEPNFHQEWGRCWLLDRLPLVEVFHEAVAMAEGQGRLVQLDWHQETALDAVAVYEEGWCALFWSGLLESQSHLDERLVSFGPDLLNWSAGNRSPLPSLFIFVAQDRWQEELVLRVARKHRLLPQGALLCAADGRRRGQWNGRYSFGGFFKPAIPMDLGGEGWDQRVRRIMGDVKDARDRRRIMDAAAQWPGMETKFARTSLGESEKGKRATRVCKTLFDAEMLQRRLKGGKGYRYAVSARGFRPLAMRDRVSSGTWQAWARVPEWRGHTQLQGHEDGLMELMRQFMEADLDIASGTRSREHMGHAGAIVPDGMVYLFDSPYGEGWHYVEYERSARWLNDARDKLNGYLAPARQDDWPVLFVLWDEDAERLFQELGRPGGLPMLTTTLGRLEAVGAAGMPGCWSMYGEDVVIGATSAAK